MSAKKMKRRPVALGLGTMPILISVAIPKVPSDPAINLDRLNGKGFRSSSRLYPDTRRGMEGKCFTNFLFILRV